MNTPDDFEVRDGMRIWWDAPITMSDGTVLRADAFLPLSEEPVPVIMTMGPYGKGRRIQDEPYAYRWQQLITQHPEVTEGSDCSYLTYETVDPQRWTAAGYAVVRVDERGTGASQGHLQIFSEQEPRDFYEAIEWAGTRPWCTGKVGLCGISYYAITQWNVAALQPPHLAAMCPWEGALDHYRDMTRHGGILSNLFFESWYPLQVLSNQHGLGSNGPINPWTGGPATGEQTLSESELATRRTDPLPGLRAHPLDDGWHQARTPDLSKITVPVLSAANWFGQGLHNRGNFEGFRGVASLDKWLEVHPGRHEEWFYLPHRVELQQRFFDHFLKGMDNGFQDSARVQLNIPHPDGSYTTRTADTWPLPDTAWQELHLHPTDHTLRTTTPTTQDTVSFDGLGEPVTFITEALDHDTIVAGPLAARLQVSTTATDADLFLTVRVFAPEGKEVTFDGASAPAQPLSNGWLRLSHRKLDPARSLPWLPLHPHDEQLPVDPGEIYPVQVEIWPTGTRLPAGYRLGLTIGGTDFARPGDYLGQSSLFLHNDTTDRPPSRFSGTTTLHFGPAHDNVLLTPYLAPTSGAPEGIRVR
jgi:uncharacterized protein